MNTIIQLSASELARKIKAGELSSHEVTEAHIQRIEEVNTKINAVVIPMFEEARAQAKEADQKSNMPVGLLHGVPITIKDQFHVKGFPTTFGVKRLKNNVIDEDGQMVSALRSAGAIILGKTNVPQTLGVVETDNDIWGRTNNPWDLSRTSGGSSGGEAAIISAGGSPLGLGGDFAGSVRLPAAWCGIYGIKPTARRLPLDSAPVRTASGVEGIVAQPGPMARSVADLKLALRLMVEDVVSKPTSFNPPVPFKEPEEVDISNLKVALLMQIGDWIPSSAIKRALLESTEVLKAQGAKIEEWTTVPDTQKGIDYFFNIVGAENFSYARQLLSEEKPVPLMKPNIQMTSMPNTIVPLITSLLGASNQRHLSRMIRNARRQSAEWLINKLGDRMAYESHFVNIMDERGYDAILCPAVPFPAVPHGYVGKLADFWGSMLLFNILGMPAGVAPITRVRSDEEGKRPESKEKAELAAHEQEQGSAGLPVAVQVVARHWREDIVLAIMSSLERSFMNQPEYPHTPVTEIGKRVQTSK